MNHRGMVTCRIYIEGKEQSEVKGIGRSFGIERFDTQECIPKYEDIAFWIIFELDLGSAIEILKKVYDSEDVYKIEFASV